MPSAVRLPSLSPSKDVSDYPLFTSGVSRWMWRIYAQRLTSAGRWFLVITSVFCMYGGISLQLQGYVPAGYVTMIWFVAGGAMILYRPRIKLSVRMGERVCAGEAVDCQIDVEQLSRMRGADLVLVPHRLPLSIDAIPDEGIVLPDLKKGQRARVNIGLKCNQRGEFNLRGFRVETGFPFGILRAWRTIFNQQKLLVYPRFTPLSGIALPTGRKYQPGGVALVSQLGESFEYLGNREYREGDNIRDIDWRATARSNRPIVREWVEEYMLRAAVVLDTHLPANLKGRQQERRRANFENAVSLAASVSDFMARQDYLVDLFAAGPDLYHLTAGRSLAYLDQILDILAVVNPSAAEPMEIIAPQLAELFARLSTAICVFLDWDDRRRQFARSLKNEGIAVKVIVCRDDPCTIEPAGDADIFGVIPVISVSDFTKGIDRL
ncbi:MAG: DUF58 domain-containing protein [Phycisphaerae bacterium]|nr:DUF58 domain-containing protein [Phycisphaerae bacterium]